MQEREEGSGEAGGKGDGRAWEEKYEENERKRGKIKSILKFCSFLLTDIGSVNFLVTFRLLITIKNSVGKFLITKHVFFLLKKNR